jgi:Ca2+-binding RTX toxin-like protein
VEDLISGFERAELSGGGGDNRINASLFTGSVRLSGEGGNDTLIGGSFDDVLIGGGGNDDLRGGTGNDTYEFDADLALGTDVIRDTGGIDWLDFGPTTEFAIRISLISTALQVVNSNLTLTLAGSTDMDNLRGRSKNDSLTGNDGDNTIDGGDGDDTINGLDGEDLFLGGNGDDTYVFDLSATNPIGLKTLLEDVGSGGIDTLRFNGTSAVSATISLATGSEQSVHSSLDLTLVRSHSIENVIGTLGDDIITGNSLDNRIEGRGGNDTIAGGLGNDVYVFDADTALGTDTLTEDPVEGGNDTLDFGTSATGVGTSVAPLSLSSTVLQTVNAFLFLTLNSTIAFENATGGSGADFIQGNNQDNLLKGGAGDDTLNGLAGNDMLEGEGGNDMLTGGMGDDDYVFGDSASGSDILTEAVNGGVDTVDFSRVTTHALTFGLNVSTAQTLWTGVTVTLSGTDRFENLAGGALDDVLTGNTLDNFIGGGLGNDRLLGRGGADSLAGGPGDDTYEFGVGAGNDLITELAGEGSDTIDFSGLGFPLEALWASSLLITFVDASFVTHSISHALDYVETLIGGSAADHVTIIPSLNTAFDFTGGAGSGDVLTFVTGGEAAVQTAGRIELPGFKAVTHRGFETIELQEALP